MNDSRSAYSYVGYRFKHNMFDKEGVLLVSEGKILSDELAEKFDIRNVNLSINDFYVDEPKIEQKDSDEQILMNDLTKQTTDIFKFIRKTNELPILEIRNNLIPHVLKISKSPNIFKIFNSLQSKADYIYRHNIAVGVLSSLIGSWLGLNEKELSLLTLSATLHDVGKMRIPEAILNKKGKLTSEEYEIMKNHTVYGYEMIKNTVGLSQKTALIALQHHERIDGSGYPFGITGDKIEYFSKIVAVADIFHAMTSQRVYKNSSSFFQIMEEMNNGVFGQFDPNIIFMFIKQIMNNLVGNEVLLSNEKVAKIIMINPHNSIKPLVMVDNDFIDLSKNSNINIKSFL
jgi:putative nucleotidyltransferase with HDIG domain